MVGVAQRSRSIAACAALSATLGCSSGDAAGTPSSTSGGAAGAPSGCDPGETQETDGTCRRAGVPPDQCAPGFIADDDEIGCVAVLPSAPCPKGKTALPGETFCRDVLACSALRFGDAPDVATTVYVDAGYAATDSDGSKARPWPTIQQGVDAAAAGAVVAVAAGSYGPFSIDGVPVIVQGRCPSLVEVVSPSSLEAIHVVSDGATVRGVAVRGDGFGIASYGSDVHADAVWVHDTALVGVYAAAKASISVSAALIEETGEVGCGAIGGSITLERSEVRRVRPSTDGGLGNGINVQPDSGAGAGSLTVRSSLVDANHDHGIIVSGGAVAIESTLIRGTLPRGDQTMGRGVGVVAQPPFDAKLTLKTSVIEANHDDGLFIGAAEATIASSVVRGTQPLPDGTSGRGLEAQWLPATGQRARLDIERSLFEANLTAGLLILSSDVTLSSSVLRTTQRDVATQQSARGLEAQIGDGGQPANVTVRDCVVAENESLALLAIGSILDVEHTAIADNGRSAAPQSAGGVIFQDELENAARSQGAVRDSRLERNAGVSILANGSDATVERTTVLDTQPTPSGDFGRGIVAQNRVETGNLTKLVLRDSTIRGSREVGVLFVDSAGDLEGVVVSETKPDAASGIGDALAVVSLDHRASVTVSASRFEQSARAGISNFGADVDVSGTTLVCNAIDLDGETYGGGAFDFVDDGKNVCGCGDAQSPCKVLTSSLAAPAPL